MKKKHIFSGAALVALSIFAAGCSSDDTTPAYEDNNTLTTFTGGSEDGEDPTTTRSSMRVEELREEGAPDNALTRTSVFPQTGKTATTTPTFVFNWEQNDYIYVKDDNGIWRKSANGAAATATSADFNLYGTFLKNNTYPVRYVGLNGTNPEQVTINKEQKRQRASRITTSQIGINGDCAVGEAKKVSQGKYKFAVTHKAAYLNFLLYSEESQWNVNYYVDKITITSDKNIAGTYTLTDTGLTNVTNESKEIIFDTTFGGQILTDITASLEGSPNTTVVIAPGTHYLTVEYSCKNDKTGKSATFKKTYKKQEFNANTIYNVPVKFTTTN